MITDPSLRWTLTVLFTVATVLAAARAVRPRGHGGRSRHGGHAAERVTHSLHALMGAAMAAMAWPWGMRLPLLPQTVLFALAAGWFTAAAALQGRGLRTARGTTYGPARTHQVLHAVAMAAMAWMVAVMPGATHSMSGTDGGSSGGTAGGSSASPGGTDGGRSAAVATGGDAHPGAHGGGGGHLQLADEARVVGLLLCLVLVAATIWWIGQLARPAMALRAAGDLGPDTGPAPRSGAARPTLAYAGAGQALRSTLDAGCHGVMACGMSVMLLVTV